MPLYDFKCNSCGHIFEDFASSEGPNPNCVQCQGPTTKQFSRFLGVVTGSENRTLDCIIGADADKKREFMQHRKEQRANGTYTRNIQSE